jgi:hypothetical protein
LDHDRLFDSLVEEEVPALPDGKHPTRGLNDIGIEDFGKSKKLSALQCVLK